MFRRLMNRPKPFSNCCCRVTTSAEETSGLKKLNADPEDDRMLFHANVAVVPVENPLVTLLLYVAVCEASDAARAATPVPAMNGLLIGWLRSSYEIWDVNSGSKLRK